MPPSGFMEPCPLAAPAEKSLVWGWDRAQGLHSSFSILMRPQRPADPTLVSADSELWPLTGPAGGTTIWEQPWPMACGDQAWGT